MVYVDEPVWKKSPRGRQSYSHMVADTAEELHAFAAQIGVHSCFWHNSGRDGYLSHYDINRDQYVKAVAAGATTVGTRKIVEISKIMNWERMMNEE